MDPAITVTLAVTVAVTLDNDIQAHARMTLEVSEQRKTEKKLAREKDLSAGRKNRSERAQVFLLQRAF